MESLAVPANTPVLSSSFSGSITYSRYQADIVVIQATLGGEDSSSAAIDDLPKSLSISAQQIVDKLNELLKADLPDGIQSLKPEDSTPEATADRIAKGATSLFDVFAKQHQDLDPEELLNKFMEEIRKGVDRGYGDAYDILDNLGAFKIDGVKDGIEKTKALVEEKLKAFEALKRQDLGLDPKSTGEQVSPQVKSEILKQAGSGVALNLVA